MREGIPRPHLLAGALIAGLLAASCRPASDAAAPPATLLITDVLVVDGTGAPAFPGGVRISGDSIVDVGVLEARPGEAVVRGGGAVLAPGFIDTHSHHDRGLLGSADAGASASSTSDATALLSQGVTTIVVGVDGGSALPLGAFFAQVDAAPPPVNVASYVGHGSVRRRVMGDDVRRPATPAEVDSMAALVRWAMEDGALGLSTGLEYEPGLWSTTDEVVQLARVAAQSGGRYATHLRSEDRALWESVDEALLIGREADVPVQISHMKLAMKSLWGRAPELLAHLDSARLGGIEVTADVYPYTYWQSTLTVLFPRRSYTLEAARFALRELAPPEGILLGRYSPRPEYEGRTLADIAKERGEDPAVTYLALIDGAYGPAAPADVSESIVATSMAEEDVRDLLLWVGSNVCSDGSLAGAHPRGWGAFTRVLGRYSRDEGLLPLEEAVRRMTGLAAEHMGFTRRGVLRRGAAADLVLFDPATVIDRATTERPHAASEGILGVWVAGRRVWADGAATGERPGRALRRGEG